MKATIETPTPYEHVMISYKVKIPNRNSYWINKKIGWYSDISNQYCIPRRWETAPEGYKRPATLEGTFLGESEIIGWEKKEKLNYNF